MRLAIDVGSNILVSVYKSLPALTMFIKLIELAFISAIFVFKDAFSLLPI